MLIAIAGLKGGVGKTTVAVHLAGEALARGHRTLLVDADTQRSALTWGDTASECGKQAPVVVGMGTGLHKQLPQMAKDYEVTVIDCPPRGDVLTRAALLVADVVVMPTGPSPTDFWALTSTLDLLEQAQTLRPELRAALLLNRMLPRQGLSASARSALAALSVPTLRTSFGFRTDYAASMATGLSVAAHAPKSQAALEVRALWDEIAEVMAA